MERRRKVFSNRGKRKVWYEDDHFWEALYPLMFREDRWLIVPEEIDKIISWLNIGPPARVLDLCCGPGRHSLELARRGFSVTGVDRTDAYLKIAREKAKAEDLKIEFIQDDMRRFSRADSYQMAINLFTSFGYFEDPEDDRKVLLNVYRSLKRNGRLIMHLMGKEVLARIFQERDWEEENGAILLQERRVSQDWSWIDNRWILLKDKTREEFKVSHRLYSAAELSALLNQCGFRSVNACGDFDGTPYDHKAKRLIMVAQK